MIILNSPLKPNISKLTNYFESIHDSGWYTNFGPLHQELTSRLEKYLGVENLLLVSNGTLALEVAYRVLNVKKALTTPFSFVATTSSLIWSNVETIFCDIDKESYNLSPTQVNQALETYTDIDTVVATHVYGNPCDVTYFERISKEKSIRVIYDAAHAFGVKVDGESVLNFGDASTLSFHATKVFHTVEGGAIVFKDRADYLLAKKIINFGINESGNIDSIGINAKLNEYQCAVGLTLLDEIEEVIEHRSNLFTCYREKLGGVVDMPRWHSKASLNGSYFPIYINDKNIQDRVISALESNKIQYRRYFSPSLDKVFTNIVALDVANSHEISSNVICLPLHNYMTTNDVDIVVNCVRSVI